MVGHDLCNHDCLVDLAVFVAQFANRGSTVGPALLLTFQRSASPILVSEFIEIMCQCLIAASRPARRAPLPLVWPDASSKRTIRGQISGRMVRSRRAYGALQACHLTTNGTLKEARAQSVAAAMDKLFEAGTFRVERMDW